MPLNKEIKDEPICPDVTDPHIVEGSSTSPKGEKRSRKAKEGEPGTKKARGNGATQDSRIPPEARRLIAKMIIESGRDVANQEANIKALAEQTRLTPEQVKRQLRRSFSNLYARLLEYAETI